MGNQGFIVHGVTHPLRMILFFLLQFVYLTTGFLLPSITMDAATYEACSTCDDRSERAGNRVVADALRQFMTKNHVKLAIKSGDVEITQTFEDARVAGGGWCNKSPRLKNIKATAKMVDDEVLLDSLYIGFNQEKNYTIFAGEVPHEVTVRADITKYFSCNLATKTCGTSASSRGINDIDVNLAASDISTAIIAGQEHIQFNLDVTVLDYSDVSTYGTLSAPKGTGCDLDVFGINIGSINGDIQKYVNRYLQRESEKVTELRSTGLLQTLEDVLKAKLGSTVTIPVRITGGHKGNGKKGKRSAVPSCRRKTCPEGFSRIGNTERCQKFFGRALPNCSQYGATASLYSEEIAGGRRTVYFCNVDMV